MRTSQMLFRRKQVFTTMHLLHPCLAGRFIHEGDNTYHFSTVLPNRSILLVLCAMILLFLPACSRRAEVKAPPPYQTGQASWYGKEFQNKRTASGEKFDMNQCTAAHRTLPFDTIVRVENLKNGRMVDVRINDRGPSVEGRIIDLSRKAAEKLGMIRDGVVPVRIQVRN